MTLFDNHEPEPDPPEHDDGFEHYENPYADDEPPHVSLTVPRGDNPPTPFERGMKGSDLAARRWTDDEIAAVDQAIARVASRVETFTSDDVWLELGDEFLVTKGLASRLNAARNRGLIVNTGETRIATRPGVHNKAQRLSLWRSLAVGREEAS